MQIDITTTGTIRPNLFRQDLESFTYKLFTNQKYYRLILNIDPIGEDIDPMEMVKVGKKFFNNVVYNIPENPNFAQAVKWCWGMTVSDFVFHLEDDWTLSRNININDMISILEKHKNMQGLRLPKLNLKQLDKQDLKKSFIKNKKLLLNPVLYKGDFIREIGEKMNIFDNPERQLRKNFKLTGDKYTGIYCGPGSGEYVKHLGRKWQKQSKYKKVKGSNFVSWEEKGE